MITARLTNIVLRIVLVIALTFRLYQLPQRAIFTADEEYQATYAKTLVDDFHPIWIGVSASDTGFYLGPYFTYLTALWLKISTGDPLLTNYISSMLGVFTVYAIYYLGQLIGTRQSGLIASTIYAFSPLMVYLDQRYWNPSPTPLITVLLLIALIKLKDSEWWLLLVSFCLGAIWHVHLSIAPLYLVAVVELYLMRRTLKLRSLILSGLIYLIMLAPLMIFDYYHNYSNLLTPARVLSSPNTTLSIASSLNSLSSTISRSLFLSQGTEAAAEIRPGCEGSLYTAHTLLGFITLLPILFLITKRAYWAKRSNRLLLLSLLTLMFSYLLFPGDKVTYYALGIFPLYYLALATLMPSLLTLLLPLYMALSIVIITGSSSDFGLSHKKTLINKVTDYLGGQSFTLVEEGKCYKYGGWRYLFMVYGQAPTSSSTDASLGWLYPGEIGIGGKYLVRLGATRELDLSTSKLATFTEGGYTAVVTYEKP